MMVELAQDMSREEVRSRKEALNWLLIICCVILLVGIVVGILIGYPLGQGWPFLDSSGGEGTLSPSAPSSDGSPASPPKGDSSPSSLFTLLQNSFLDQLLAQAWAWATQLLIAIGSLFIYIFDGESSSNDDSLGEPPAETAVDQIGAAERTNANSTVTNPNTPPLHGG